MNKQDLLNRIEMDEEEFIKWSQSFSPELIYFWDDTPCCLYADGDGGIALIRGFCDVFEEKGFQISFPIPTLYCDISFDDMSDIIANLKKNIKTYLKELEETE